MTLKDLFDVGTNFEQALTCGTQEEKDNLLSYNEQIIFPTELASQIKAYNKPIHFLVAGEIWCKDYQLNMAVLKHFLSLNPLFECSVITMSRGRKFLAPLLDASQMSFPTIAVLDGDFQVLGAFYERPHRVRQVEDFDTIREAYIAGNYLLDTAYDLLAILS